MKCNVWALHDMYVTCKHYSKWDLMFRYYTNLDVKHEHYMRCTNCDIITWSVLNVWSLREMRCNVWALHVMFILMFGHYLKVTIMFENYLKCSFISYYWALLKKRCNVWASHPKMQHNVLFLHEMSVMFKYYLRWGIMHEHYMKCT